MDANVDAREWEGYFSEPVVEGTELPVPAYLQRIYWWTYIHPLALKVFDHQWVVNAILLTQYNHMRTEVLDELGDLIPGKTLQISCAYGDITPKLVRRVAAAGGTLDVVDVLSIQLENAKRKLPAQSPVRLRIMNAEKLDFASEQYDQVVLYFLLHEVPDEVRTKTLQEAMRVLKPGGKLVVADFAMPARWNPFRYLWAVFLTIFEPFALDMWHKEMHEIMPKGGPKFSLTENRYFGRLFRKAVIRREA